MKYGKVILILIFISFLYSSCKKEDTDISIKIYATHSDYDAFEAIYVSIQSIVVDGKNANLDFDTWSNISEGETRQIPITISAENDIVSVTISASSSGSGISKNASISGVKNGDNLDLDLATSIIIIR